jgi:antitoxin component of MazEF toxin-antitoxin module
MKLTLSVDGDRKVIIPAEVIERLHLEPGASVRVKVSAGIVKPYVFNQEKFDAAMRWDDEHREEFRQRMRDDGYASVDEYMNDIRPPW